MTPYFEIRLSVFYLSSGNSIMVWNFPWRAAGPSPTSMYLFSVTMGEVTWACVLAWASSNVSSLVDGEETSRDLGRDREASEGTGIMSVFVCITLSTFTLHWVTAFQLLFKVSQWQISQCFIFNKKQKVTFQSTVKFYNHLFSLLKRYQVKVFTQHF